MFAMIRGKILIQKFALLPPSKYFFFQFKNYYSISYIKNYNKRRERVMQNKIIFEIVIHHFKFKENIYPVNSRK